MSKGIEGLVASASGALDSEKRVRYRTSPLEPLWVTVPDRQGREIAALVLDVSVGGICLFFGHVGAPDYRVGESVKTYMRSSHLDEPLMAGAEVCRVEQCELGRAYGLKFVNQMNLTSQLPPELSRVFNQRRHCRVAPDPARPVEVTIEGLPLTSWGRIFGIKGVLRDLSPSGLSFHTDAEMGEIESCASMEISFSVPGSTELFTFWVQTRHSGTGAEGARWGAVFDKERTQQFSEKREKLLAALRGKAAARNQIARANSLFHGSGAAIDRSRKTPSMASLV